MNSLARKNTILEFFRFRLLYKLWKNPNLNPEDLSAAFELWFRSLIPFDTTSLFLANLRRF